MTSDAIEPDEPEAFEPEAPSHLDPDSEEVVHVIDLDEEAVVDEAEGPADVTRQTL
jgi:hypothetical protein